ncbi:hypothetical protein OF83DRAFT_788000 [Amylostereum chailletii]|nr:hypothetical protein OF83DRAFT_788000 [Amylostereum chailletii]
MRSTGNVHCIVPTDVTVPEAPLAAPTAVHPSIHILHQGNIGKTFGSEAGPHFESFLKRPLAELPIFYEAPRPGWVGAYAVAQHHLRGPVVQQELWTPHSRRVWEQHVQRAELRPPTFFLHTNGAVGLALTDVLSGNFAIHAADEEINVGRSSIHLHIKVCRF